MSTLVDRAVTDTLGLLGLGTLRGWAADPMPDEDKHSRTEKPTAKRKKEARREGRWRAPPKWSPGWSYVGTYLIEHTFNAKRDALEQKLWSQIANTMSRPSITADISVAEQGGKGVLSCLAPAVLTTMALALLVNLAQTRGLVTFKPLKPSFYSCQPGQRLEATVLSALGCGRRPSRSVASRLC